jgi:hypothetical protein
MNTGELDLSFNEVMSIASLKRDYFKLQGAKPSDGVNEFTLSA